MASFRKHETKKGIRWEARIHRTGFPAICRRFASKAEAEVWARSQEGHIDKGDSPPSRAKATTTVDHAIESYMDQHKKIRPAEIASFKMAKHDWQGIGIRALSKSALETWVAKLSETPVPPLGPAGKGKQTPYADNTIRLAFYALKKAILWHAERTKYSVPGNLFEVKLPKAWSRPRSRRCNLEEQKKLLAACKDVWHARAIDWQRLIRFLLETALRLQEAVLAEWPHLSADGRMLFVPGEHTKTREPRWVPLTQEARRIIVELRGDINEESPRLFWHIRKPHDGSQAFKVIRQTAGVKDMRIHDLRHEATSRLVESKLIDSYRIMLMTGHSDIRTFKRYAQPEDMAACFD